MKGGRNECEYLFCGGVDLSEITAQASDVMPGKYIIDKNGDKIVGSATSDATASAADIKKGKVAYVNGNRIVGTYNAASAARSGFFGNLNITNIGQGSQSFLNKFGIYGSSLSELNKPGPYYGFTTITYGSGSAVVLSPGGHSVDGLGRKEQLCLAAVGSSSTSPCYTNGIINAGSAACLSSSQMCYNTLGYDVQRVSDGAWYKPNYAYYIGFDGAALYYIQVVTGGYWITEYPTYYGYETVVRVVGGYYTILP